MNVANSQRPLSLRSGYGLRRLSEPVTSATPSVTPNGEDDWRRKIKQQIDDEINRRVRDALETPPLERIRRRQLQSQAKAAAIAAAESHDLNAHLDLTEKERDYLLARKRQLRNKQQSRAESEPDLSRAEDTYNRFISEKCGLGEGEGISGRVYTGNGFVPVPNQRPPHIQSGISYDDWAFTEGTRNRPSYPDGVAPIIPHPKFKNIIHPSIEPLYTSMPIVPGATTYDNQVTPYQHKWRGICIVYDSEKSPKVQGNMEQPSNPNYAPNLIFESRFECGNLRQARRVGQFEYELVLKTDVFTKRHTQWYYFRVQNMLPGIIYKFRIVNLLKRDSLYNHGMRPLMYSERSAEEKEVGWIRHGHHINYGRNVLHTVCPLLSREIPYYELEFQMEFPYAEDTVYLAHCYPYSYTDMKTDLDTLLADPKRSQYTKREILCDSKAGNRCYLVTVTNFDSRAKKEHVVVSARVHPGESNSSWMLKGLVDFITGESKEAAEIRKRFIFKIIPMLNPDGVIVGNYRCSLQAKDLNRNYRHPTRENFPTVWNLKKLIENLNNTVGVFAYCDFHGHSRRENVFMYGNNTSAENAGKPGYTRAFLEERMLPYCISKVGTGSFSFDSCKFAIRKCKESTGRVVMYRQYAVKNSFTMEATFSGTLLDKENGARHFNQKDFMNAGKHFALGVLEYAKVQDDEEKQAEVITDLTRTVTKQLIASSKLNSTLKASISAMMAELFKPDDQQKSEGESQVPEELEEEIPASESGEDNSTIKQTEEQTASDKTNQRRAAVIKALDNITEQTLAKCMSLLEKLALPSEDNVESESSDSDSESEPELIEDKNKKKKKNSKSKRRKDKKQVKSPSSLSDRYDKKSGFINSSSASSSSHLQKQRTTLGISAAAEHTNSQTARLPLIASASDPDKNGKCKAHWTNPYEGRSNGGIPCFSEERSMERAAKRMAELQKRMEEKTSAKQSFGPFYERDFTDISADLYYDDLANQKRMIEENLHKSMKALRQNPVGYDRVHMDFMRDGFDEEQESKRKSNLAPNTNQFELTTKRSRTDLTELKKHHNHWRKPPDPWDTWNESEVRNHVYQPESREAARISHQSNNEKQTSCSTKPPSIPIASAGTYFSSTTPAADKYDTNQFLTREYTDIIASKFKANVFYNRAPAKTPAARSNLLKALQVNSISSQPGLE